MHKGKALSTLGVEALVFERCVSGDTRFCCSAQCAEFVALGGAFEPSSSRVRNIRRLEDS